MILLNLNNVAKYYGPEPVLSGVTFEMRSGDKAALVGPNGAGKSTLMRIICGDEDADGGEVVWRPGAKMGYLEQQPEFNPEETVWEIAEQALVELAELAADAEAMAARLADAADERERLSLGQQYDRLHHQLEQRGGYQLNHKIERILTGLGFASSTFKRPAGQLSGGQQNRLLLARLLLAEPDLMLLDEPSNHLDIEATEWLESFLVGSQQAVLLVSHDRFLLDRVATKTLELVHGTIDSYAGNYTAYQRQKSERLEVQRRTFEKQQEEIAKLEDFVRRHHHGQKHAQAEDRKKKLERIEPVPPPREISAPPMGFPAATRTGDIVMRVERLAKAFDKPLFEQLTFDILRGEKWGILGPNGSGKTTLLRCLIGDLEADAGSISLGAGVKIGYFDQQLQGVSSEAEAVEAVRPDHKEFVEGQRRDLLARFGITGDMVFQKVHSLSGGERNRTALARLAALDANVLVLDEPTNHLDLWARESLEKSLNEFDGTVLFVSHDRYFINQIADRLLVVEPDRFRVIEGNYDTYLHMVKVGLVSEATSSDLADEPPKKPKEKQASKNNGAGKRKRKFPYRKVADLEDDIAALETRVEEIHQSLTDVEILRDGEAVRNLQAELKELEERLPQLYEHWEEASELNG